MKEDSFQSKTALIMETDGLLKDYLETVAIKNTKSERTDGILRYSTPNHIHAVLIFQGIAPCALRTRPGHAHGQGCGLPDYFHGNDQGQPRHVPYFPGNRRPHPETGVMRILAG